QGGGDAVDGHGQVQAGEQAVQAPEAGAGAVFVHRLDVPMALALPWGGADHIDEEGLRGRVAVQDIVLATFLIVEDELHRHIGAARPLRMRRVGAVALHVAGITHASTSSLIPDLSPSRTPRRKAAESGPIGKKLSHTPLE